MKEIKIQPNTNRINIDGNKITRNKSIVNKSTHDISKIQKYSWEEALAQKVFPQKGPVDATLKNIKTIFNDILGIPLNDVTIYVETIPGSYKSFYAKANYHGEPLLFARRETPIGYIGQTKLYSKRGKIVTIPSYIDINDLQGSKQKILQALKIPTDLAEIMIQPNNQATLDRFEDRDTETAPVIAPPKPGVKPETPPKRRRLGNPDVQPKPKAKLEEAGKDDILNKIVQRFNSLKHAA